MDSSEYLEKHDLVACDEKDEFIDCEYCNSKVSKQNLRWHLVIGSLGCVYRDGCEDSDVLRKIVILLKEINNK